MKTIQEALLDRLDKVTELYQGYRNNPFDVEITHDLRVSIRELRALLNIIKPAIDEENYDSLNQGLKESAKVFGLVRELDVLTELCSQVAVENPGLSEHYYDLFHFLDIQRRKEMRRTFNKTNSELIEGTLVAMQQFIEALEDHVDNQDWDAFVAERLANKFEKVQADYEDLDREDYEAVHTVRKNAKKSRYGAKYFKKVTSMKTKPIRKESEAIQDELGEYTDYYINRQMLEDFAQKAEKAEVAAVIQAILDYLEAEEKE